MAILVTVTGISVLGPKLSRKCCYCDSFLCVEPKAVKKATLL
jgi:hypothetical protein